MVRERFPRLSAAQVVKRIEATADRPGATVPHDGYGCGIVNPYRALTQVLDGSPADVRRAPPCSYAADRTDKKSYITPPNPAEPPDRTLQNIAYGVAAGLLGAAALFAIGTGAWRRTQAAHRELRQAADQ
jgi:membrane-anchored mycosin MYCP